MHIIIYVDIYTYAIFYLYIPIHHAKTAVCEEFDIPSYLPDRMACTLKKRK